MDNKYVYEIKKMLDYIDEAASKGNGRLYLFLLERIGGHILAYNRRCRIPLKHFLDYNSFDEKGVTYSTSPESIREQIRKKSSRNRYITIITF